MHVSFLGTDFLEGGQNQNNGSDVNMDSRAKLREEETREDESSQIT
jgi:hypothetical protein